MSAKRVRNGARVALDELGRSSFDELRSRLLREVEGGARIASLFGMTTGEDKELVTVLAHDTDAELSLLRSELPERYPSLTPEVPQAHWFERELAEQWGVVPEGHPWLKPIRFERGLNGKREHAPKVGVTDFFRVAGAEVHEVGVGPVHAGVIEPGHFRFQCHGEVVLHLEISLGYQHRGVERALLGGPHKISVHQMETLAGDTSVGHVTAYCQALESLAGSAVPARSQVIRAIGLELERLANHTGDLGALAGDVGYLPTAAYCGRIRGDFLNLTALVAGNRFGRGLVRPGGVAFELDDDLVAEMLGRLERAERDVKNAVDILFASASVQSRFEETGIVTREACQVAGVVGLVARAAGLDRDVRHNHPAGAYRFHQLPMATAERGDVYSRALVRWLEIEDSIAYIKSRMKQLPRKSEQRPLKALAPRSIVASLVEGWRGEICHVAVTDGEGRFARYKVTDPSFHNWFAVALALRDQQISDFPLCNKSMNLSYCGHDL